MQAQKYQDLNKQRDSEIKKFQNEIEIYKDRIIKIKKDVNNTKFKLKNLINIVK